MYLKWAHTHQDVHTLWGWKQLAYVCCDSGRAEYEEITLMNMKENERHLTARLCPVTMLSSCVIVSMRMGSVGCCGFQSLTHQVISALFWIAVALLDKKVKPWSSRETKTRQRFVTM